MGDDLLATVLAIVVLFVPAMLYTVWACRRIPVLPSPAAKASLPPVKPVEGGAYRTPDLPTKTKPFTAGCMFCAQPIERDSDVPTGWVHQKDRSMAFGPCSLRNCDCASETEHDVRMSEEHARRFSGRT